MFIMRPAWKQENFMTSSKRRRGIKFHRSILLGDGLAEEKEASQVRFLQIKKVRRWRIGMVNIVGDSDKVIELLARMKQLTLAYKNTLTNLNGYRGQIKRAKWSRERYQVKRNHFICLLFSSYHLTIHFYVYICTSLWSFDFFLHSYKTRKSPKSGLLL